LSSFVLTVQALPFQYMTSPRRREAGGSLRDSTLTWLVRNARRLSLEAISAAYAGE
jgi:hypothetical protein